jgi:hypothetical protein
MAVLLPEGKQSFETSTGIPLVSGKVFTYDAGTSTPRNTYADAAGTTPNANPVILDARGEATIFWSGAYKVVLKDASDNIIWTVDGIVDPTTASTGLVNTLRADLADTSSAAKNSGLVGLNATLAYAAYTLGARLVQEAVHVKDYPWGAKLDGTTDDTSAIQSAITAIQGTTKRLVINGPAKITSALTITAKITIDFCNRQGQLLLATQNMDGIKIGDGTAPARTACFNTVLLGPAFAPFPGVGQFTTGACINENYVAYVDVIRPSFYGLDAGTRKLFNGLLQLRATECDTPYILGQEMHGDIVTASGTATVANRTVDCNYDNARFLSSDGNGMTWGNNCAGLGMLRPEAYGLIGWCLKIDTPAGANGQNFFVTDPDFEIEPTSAGGIWAKSGSALICRGGWMGANGISGTLPIGFQIDSTFDTAEIGIGSLYGTRNIINGPACKVTSGDFAGDNTTAGVCITIGANDTQVASDVSIRQYVGTGIGWSGTPTGVLIGAMKFKNNGTDITAPSAWGALVGPVIGNCQTDKARTGYTAAATTNIPATVNFTQITGTTNITTIPVQGVGSALTIQATGSTVNLAAGGNLQLRAAPVAIAAGFAIHLKCDGVNWFEQGRNF